MAATYKTHILLGIKTGGKAYEVGRWEHSPNAIEVSGVIDKELTNYNEFVLVAPVGDTHVGTYVEPTQTYDCCG